MTQKYFLLILIFISGFQLNAQTLPGKLLLVGGGAENYNSWSDEPYGWAIEQSENKRVAIITYETNPSQWLPNYFKSLGALEAKNFSITSSAIADQQQTYDSLVTYDVLFFKGGNQRQYYNMYKNTLTHDAVEFVFNNGGVIGGTSAGEMVLSRVLFTAQNGTVYPDEAISNPNNQYMTLADDFLNLIPGYIFDSHFVERARFGRLIGFLGNWKLNQGEDIIGIGVDDKTAFCIDENMMGYAFGTGAANIYRAAPDNQFSLGESKLLATNIEVTQVLNGKAINLNTFDVSGYEDFIPTKYEGEDFGGYVLMSGSDNVNKNEGFIAHFAEAVSRDSILIITGANISLAEQIKTRFEQNNAPAEIMQAIAENHNSDYYLGKVDRLKKIVFVNNQFSTLMDFMTNGTVGQLLWERLLEGSKVTGFVGGDSRYAGGSALVNYDQQYASYDGLLEFEKGLGLLRSMIIMPNTFLNADIEENAAAGVPFGMLTDSLKYGIWLHDNAFAEYKINDQNETTITSYGDYPMMLIESEGTYGGFSDQSAVNSGRPRHVAGFDLLSVTLMDESMTKTLGFFSNVNEPATSSKLAIYPNPTGGSVSVMLDEQQKYLLKIFSADGRIVFQQMISKQVNLDLSMLPNGLYVVTASSMATGRIKYQKLIIRK